MRHHILIPTDYSENAWSAALYALKLYADEPCTFYFLHVWTFVNTGSRTYISPSYIDLLKNTSKAQLDALKDRAKVESTNSDHEFQTIFSVESLTDSIKIAVTTHQINLVVMGTKGATGAKEFLLGSNTVTVVQKVRLCPLMLIPNNFEFETPNYIAFPTDFIRSYGDELEYLKKLADLHNSKIEVLHIQGRDELTDTQHSNLEILKNRLEDYQHSFNWIPEKGTKEHIISNFIQEKKINLLTMINYEHGFIEDLIKEPVINKMGFHSIIPFMVIYIKH